MSWLAGVAAVVAMAALTGVIVVCAVGMYLVERWGH